MIEIFSKTPNQGGSFPNSWKTRLTFYQVKSRGLQFLQNPPFDWKHQHTSLLHTFLERAARVAGHVWHGCCTCSAGAKRYKSTQRFHGLVKPPGWIRSNTISLVRRWFIHRSFPLISPLYTVLPFFSSSLFPYDIHLVLPLSLLAAHVAHDYASQVNTQVHRCAEIQRRERAGDWLANNAANHVFAWHLAIISRSTRLIDSFGWSELLSRIYLAGGPFDYTFRA